MQILPPVKMRFPSAALAAVLMVTALAVLVPVTAQASAGGPFDGWQDDWMTLNGAQSSNSPDIANAVAPVPATEAGVSLDRDVLSPGNGVVTISYSAVLGQRLDVDLYRHDRKVRDLLTIYTTDASNASGSLTWDGNREDGRKYSGGYVTVVVTSRDADGSHRTTDYANIEIDTDRPKLWGSSDFRTQAGERFLVLPFYASEDSDVMAIVTKGNYVWRSHITQPEGSAELTVPVPAPWAGGAGLECRLDWWGWGGGAQSMHWKHGDYRRGNKLARAVRALQKKGLFKKRCEWNIRLVAVDAAGNVSDRRVDVVVAPNKTKAKAAIKAWIKDRRKKPRSSQPVPLPDTPAGPRVLPAWLHPIMVRATVAAGVPQSWATSPALYNIMLREAGFNPRAQNPTSTAYGMFQFLNQTWATVGCKKTSDAYQQSVCGLKYIERRYHTPNAAWRFWQANHWY